MPVYADEEQRKQVLKSKPKLGAALNRIYKKNPSTLKMFLKAKLWEYGELELKQAKQEEKEAEADEDQESINKWIIKKV